MFCLVIVRQPGYSGPNGSNSSGGSTHINNLLSRNSTRLNQIVLEIVYAPPLSLNMYQISRAIFLSMWSDWNLWRAQAKKFPYENYLLVPITNSTVRACTRKLQHGKTGGKIWYIRLHIWVSSYIKYQLPKIEFKIRGCLVFFFFFKNSKTVFDLKNSKKIFFRVSLQF